MQPRTGSALGFAVGSVLGGLTFLLVGYVGLLQRPTGIVGGLLFFVSILAFMGAFVAPFALAMFVGRGRESLAGKQLLSMGANVLTVLFLFALGLVGVYVLDPLGIDTATELMVVLDGVFGFVWGGIVGALLIRRHVRRKHASPSL